jgi:hypothetical protein
MRVRAALRRALGVVGVVLVAVAVLGPSRGIAHQFAPALLELMEDGSGKVSVLWKEPVIRPMGSRLQPVLPGECQGIGEPRTTREGTGILSEWTLDCPDGLVGTTVAVEGIALSRANVLLRIQLADGQEFAQVLRPEVPYFAIPGSASGVAFALTYIGVGIEHILLGLDHLLFVLGLLLIVRGLWPLVKTITAFTVAHSITLGLAVLGIVTVPQGPVEIAIALSIAYLAVEILRAQQGHYGLTYRRPWVVAFGFGLIHGLGFAGALNELGIPPADIPAVLLFFNIGVELGQLLFVAGFFAVIWAVRQLRLQGALQARVAAYLIGSIAAYWSIERSVGVLGSI